MTEAPTGVDQIDPLQQMLDAQVRFQSAFEHFSGAIPLTQQMIDNSMMMMMEAHEVMDVLPWKKHGINYARKLTDKERDSLAEELIDVQHFVLNLLILLGYTESYDVLRIFMKKNEFNLQRQFKRLPEGTY